MTIPTNAKPLILRSQLAEAQRERDAAVADLKLHGGCPFCIFKQECEANDMLRLNLDFTSRHARCTNYAWRGKERAQA